MNGGIEMDVREKLIELLAKYFNIGDSYAYNLTRVKSAFSCGTMGFDDFEEFDEETVADIADYLIANGVTVQEWISVDDKLPDEHESLFARYKGTDKWRNGMFTSTSGLVIVCAEYENGERIVRTANTIEGLWKVKDSFYPCKVTHWMPLPSPPKGE